MNFPKASIVAIIISMVSIGLFDTPYAWLTTMLVSYACGLVDGGN
jgi:hypothetical protein